MPGPIHHPFRTFSRRELPLRPTTRVVAFNTRSFAFRKFRPTLPVGRTTPKFALLSCRPAHTKEGSARSPVRKHSDGQGTSGTSVVVRLPLASLPGHRVRPNHPIQAFGRRELTLQPATPVVAFDTQGFTFQTISANECSLRLGLGGHQLLTTGAAPHKADPLGGTSSTSAHWGARRGARAFRTPNNSSPISGTQNVRPGTVCHQVRT